MIFIIRLTSYIATTLAESGIVDKADAEICRYGIELFIISVGEILAVLLLSIFVGNFFETLLFFVGFAPLRLYAGGYHSDTRLRCFLVLLGVFFLITAIFRFVPIDTYQILICINSFFSLVIVFAFAPVINVKKTTTAEQASKFRKISVVICTIESILLITLTLLNINNVYILALSYGQLAVVISMIAANIKSKYGKGE